MKVINLSICAVVALAQATGVLGAPASTTTVSPTSITATSTLASTIISTTYVKALGTPVVSDEKLDLETEKKVVNAYMQDKEKLVDDIKPRIPNVGEKIIELGKKPYPYGSRIGKNIYKGKNFCAVSYSTDDWVAVLHNEMRVLAVEKSPTISSETIEQLSWCRYIKDVTTLKPSFTMEKYQYEFNNVEYNNIIKMLFDPRFRMYHFVFKVEDDDTKLKFSMIDNIKLPTRYAKYENCFPAVTKLHPMDKDQTALMYVSKKDKNYGFVLAANDTSTLTTIAGDKLKHDIQHLIPDYTNGKKIIDKLHCIPITNWTIHVAYNYLKTTELKETVELSQIFV